MEKTEELYMKKKVIFLPIFLIALCILTLYPRHVNQSLLNFENDLTTNAAYILIDGDVELATNASEGFGNSTHPYIIEDYFVGYLGTDGITIQNTNAHFILRNCTIYEVPGDNGILLSNVTNANVSWNNISNARTGIRLTNVNDSVIENNEIFHLSGRGLYSINCWNVSFFGNNLTDLGSYGMELWVRNCIFEKNNITDTSTGVYLFRNGNNTFINNFICKNDVYGFRMYEVFNDTFILNQVNNNTLRGFHIKECLNCTIYNNEINNNGATGVYLLDTNHTNVSYNVILDNTDCVVENGSCTGNTIEGNTCTRPGDSPPVPPPIPGFSIIVILIVVTITAIISYMKIKRPLLKER